MPSALLQAATDAAAAGKPWAADAIAALVDGGLGSLRLARAESIAQSARVFTAPGSAQEDRFKPKSTRRLAADVMWGAAQSMTPAVPRAIFKRGLLKPLLEVGFGFPELFCLRYCVQCQTLLRCPWMYEPLSSAALIAHQPSVGRMLCEQVDVTVCRRRESPRPVMC